MKNYNLLILLAIMLVIVGFGNQVYNSNNSDNLSTISGYAVNTGSKLELYDQALKDILDMKEAGFNIERVNSSYQEALSTTDPELIEIYVRDINVNRLQAFELNDLLAARKIEIDTLGEERVYTGDLLNQYNKAKIAFDKGDLATAKENNLLLEKQLSDVRSASEFEKLYVKVKKRNFFSPIMDHKYIFLVILIILGIVSIISAKPLRKKYLKSKKEKLIKEQETLEYLLKLAQTEYFRKKKISKYEYHIKLDRYRKKDNLIKKEIKIIDKSLKNE